MILQAHGVGDDLKAVVKTTIVFAVDVLNLGIGDVQNLIGIVTVLTGFIDLQLHTEIARAFTAEQWVGFVVIVVDAAVIVVLVAGEAVSFIAVTAGVERIVLADEPAAVGTGGVVIVVAIPAEGRIICTVVVVPPDAVTAPGVGGGQLSKAVRAEQFTVECCEG